MDINNLAKKALDVCLGRGWSTHWMARGAYLHLESSELIESLRGKGDSTPLEEAADVLFVLMSITENEGLLFTDVLEQANKTMNKISKSERYKGEEFTFNPLSDGEGNEQ